MFDYFVGGPASTLQVVVISGMFLFLAIGGLLACVTRNMDIREAEEAKERARVSAGTLIDPR